MFVKEAKRADGQKHRALGIVSIADQIEQIILEFAIADLVGWTVEVEGSR
jgi:hypothetical protein